MIQRRHRQYRDTLGNAAGRINGVLANTLASLENQDATCLVGDYASRVGKIASDFDRTIGWVNRIAIEGSGYIRALSARYK